MKHLIIINSAAGKHVVLDALVKQAFVNEDYEIFHSTGPRSAVGFLKEYFSKEKELTRVYACGGDGTLHEVVNGLMGVKNAELALYASGTGNDFAKVYGGVTSFNDFAKLKTWKASPIDITKITSESMKEPWYSINVVNFGFDAVVGDMGNKNKEKGKKNPYGFKNAIVPAIKRGRFNRISVFADGENINGEKLLLASISQGQWVGGSFHASPLSDNTDGLLEIVIMKCMSLFTLLTKYFKAYQNGTHVTNPKLAKKGFTRRVKTAQIKSDNDFAICVDGEMLYGKSFELECLPGAIKFVMPEKE